MKNLWVKKQNLKFDFKKRKKLDNFDNRKIFLIWTQDDTVNKQIDKNIEYNVKYFNFKQITLRRMN